MARIASVAHLIAGTALALLVAGCTGGDPEPDPTPIVESSSSGSPSASETPEPEMSPEEVVRAWVDASTRFQRSGDPTPYLTLTDNCDPCEKFAESVVGFYDAGGWIKTDGWRIVRIEKSLVQSGRAEILATVESSPTRFRRSQDAEVESFPGGVLKERFLLIKRDGRWLMREYSERAG